MAVLENAPTRDRVLFTLMLRTGIRIGSALALKADDVDLDQCELRLQRVKGNREDTVFFPPALRDCLREVMGDGLLFPISARHATRRFHRYLAEAGVRLQGTHSLRHTFAMSVYQRTGDLLLTKEALGHRSIVSTTVYARSTPTQLRAALTACSPASCW